MFAMRLGVDVGTLSRWERGLHLPRSDHRVRIQELVGRRVAAQTVAALPQDGCATLDDVNRREFLREAAMGVTGLAAGSVARQGEPWERLLSALRPPVSPGLHVVEEVEAETAGFFVLEEHVRARQLMPLVAGHLERVTELLRGTADDPLRQRLIVSAGETAALGGWLAWDMRDRHRALSLYRTADIAGSEADDGLLRACVLGYRSYMAGGDGDPRLAVELLTHARQLVDARHSPATYAWLGGRLAEEGAVFGHDGALRAFEEGQEIYECASPEQERVWTRFLDRNRMGGFGVSAYARLGLAEPALRLVDGYLTAGAGSEDKKRSMILADVANICVQRGEVDRGVDLASRALAIATKTECSLGLNRLMRLRPHLSRHRSVPKAWQLHEQLQALSTC